MAGYTVAELLMLCRSSVVAQRSLAMEVLSMLFEEQEAKKRDNRAHQQLIDRAFLIKARAEVSVFNGYMSQSKSLRASWIKCVKRLLE